MHSSIQGKSLIAFLLLLLPVPVSLTAAVVDLQRTGQTFCSDASGLSTPCAGTGHDGDIQAGLVWPDARFTDNSDGTITDNLTKLIWLADTECIDREKWFDAVAETNALADGTCDLTDGSAAGDWRMPNMIELMSLTHMGVVDFPAWVKSFGFKNLRAFGYWSSSTTPISTSSVYGYQFVQRFGGSFLKSGTYQTWPVRGLASGPAKLWKTGQSQCFDQTGNSLPCAGSGQDGEIQAGLAWPTPRFTDNQDGTVTDKLTDLIWLKQAGCLQDLVWSEAVAGANSLQSGACGLTDGSAAGDWRLPNTWEMTSLIDFSRYPALPANHPFTNLPNQYHWTSTTFPVSTEQAYLSYPLSNGNYGFISKSSPSFPGSAWPVRGGYIVVPPLFEDEFESGSTSAWSATLP